MRLQAAALFAVGCLAVGGVAFAVAEHQADTQHQHVRARDREIVTLKADAQTAAGKLSDTRHDLSDAKKTAATAVQHAQQQVDARDAQRKQALDQREQSLNQRAASLDQQQQQLDQMLGGLKQSQFSDGLFEVGHDIQPGKYHTDGGSGCYWAKLNSSDTSNIADNDNATGPVTIVIDSAYFQSEDCGTWTKVG
ncbi:MAG TPA: hypothetical protein VHA73_13655 [Acidimicrobiales bacterium]|nr:hypothetical protein [Acidimicrobiales bacterium]